MYSPWIPVCGYGQDNNVPAWQGAVLDQPFHQIPDKENCSNEQKLLLYSLLLYSMPYPKTTPSDILSALCHPHSKSISYAHHGHTPASSVDRADTGWMYLTKDNRADVPSTRHDNRCRYRLYGHVLLPSENAWYSRNCHHTTSTQYLRAPPIRHCTHQVLPYKE